MPSRLAPPPPPKPVENVTEVHRTTGLVTGLFLTRDILNRFFFVLPWGLVSDDTSHVLFVMFRFMRLARHRGFCLRLLEARAGQVCRPGVPDLLTRSDGVILPR